MQTIAAGQADAATSRAYFEPVVTQILARGPVPGRVEVPATAGHWESAYVADSAITIGAGLLILDSFRQRRASA